MSNPERQFLDGQVIPGTRFRVQGLIGVGGMGAVYDVEHTELGKRFVLKTLHQNLMTNEELVARLRNEWRALGRLEHPNIVNVIDAGTAADGTAYYAMERLEGEALSQRLSRHTRLPIPEAIAICEGILRGLAAAHDIGVVHRDIKPPNVFVMRDGTVKLLDFGIAKVTQSGAPPITLRGMAIGTPRYMAPEQAKGDPVDSRADLYATGLILFELVSGYSPFHAARDSNELMIAQLTQVPPLLSSMAPGVPSRLDELVRSLLCKERHQRPRSAQEVLERLREITTPSLSPAPSNVQFLGVQGPLTAMSLKRLAEGETVYQELAGEAMSGGAQSSASTMPITRRDSFGPASTESLSLPPTRSRGPQSLPQVGAVAKRTLGTLMSPSDPSGPLSASAVSPSPPAITLPPVSATVGDSVVIPVQKGPLWILAALVAAIGAVGAFIAFTGRPTADEAVTRAEAASQSDASQALNVAALAPPPPTTDESPPKPPSGSLRNSESPDAGEAPPEAARSAPRLATPSEASTEPGAPIQLPATASPSGRQKASPEPKASLEPSMAPRREAAPGAASTPAPSPRLKLPGSGL